MYKVVQYQNPTLLFGLSTLTAPLHHTSYSYNRMLLPLSSPPTCFTQTGPLPEYACCLMSSSLHILRTHFIQKVPPNICLENGTNQSRPSSGTSGNPYLTFSQSLSLLFPQLFTYIWCIYHTVIMYVLLCSIRKN